MEVLSRGVGPVGFAMRPTVSYVICEGTYIHIYVYIYICMFLYAYLYRWGGGREGERERPGGFCWTWLYRCKLPLVWREGLRSGLNWSWSCAGDKKNEKNDN